LINAVIVWFPLLAAIVVFTVAIWVLSRAPKSPPIRAFAGFAGIQAFLAFTEWGYRHSPTLAEAQMWVDIGALWPLLLAALLSLVIEIDSLGRRPPAAVLRYGMFLPALAFTVLGFASPEMQRRAVPTAWGFEYMLPSSPLMSIVLLWGVVVSLLVVGITVRTLLRGDMRARHLSRSMLKAVLVLIVINLAQSLIILTTNPEIPFLSTIGVVALAVVIGRAMLDHGVWEVAPQVSAETVLTTMQDGVVLVDGNTAVRYVNNAAKKILHLDDSPIGRPIDRVLPTDELQAEGPVRDEERRFELTDGSHAHVAFSAVPVRSSFGGWVYVLRDTSERARLQERLRQLAYTDSLSGLGNRQAFQESLQAMKSEAPGMSGSRSASALLLIDLDRFKEINDAYGHEAGDAVIREVARRLDATIRREDRAYRLGGDEFAVILKHLRKIEDARPVAEKLLADVTEPMTVGTTLTEVGASIGFTPLLSGEPDDDPLARADAALYEAKREGDEVKTFSPGDLLPTTRRGMVHRSIRKAVRERAFSFYFQPIVNARGIIIGAEALARLFVEDGSSLSPAEFIPAAEETGVIHEIGQMAREAAVELIEDLDRPPGFFVTVNVSPVELKRPELADRILSFLGEADCLESVHIEVTESAMLELGPTGRERLNDMAARGVRFYVDDFGSGYSSLARLRDLPVSTVKVDRGFLLNWDRDERARPLVDGTVRLIEGLGLNVLAEGVETEEQLRVLEEAGCFRFQGYYFYRPMPADALLYEVERLRQQSYS
jgi:diguanylate cyclase (GGDEF)-like protein